MNWKDWVKGFKDYITSNLGNSYRDTPELTDRLIIFKEDAGANQYDRIITISELSSIIGSTGSASLANDLTTEASVEGVPIGREFIAGTRLETIFREIFLPNSVSTLIYVGYSSILKCDDTIVNPSFSWVITGSPLGLTLSDNQGQLSESVTGTSYLSSETYTLAEYGSIVWTLSGSNVDSVTKTTTFVHESYYGKNTTGDIPTDTEITAETERLWPTSSSVTFNPNTSDTEYGWVAVPQTQTGKTYTSWYVTALNNGSVGSGNFIIKKGEVTIHGDVYDVYMYDYPSLLNANLTLS